ncbi:hypothetical protein PPERSA_07842 [Pseudocohnilembus persalinus]|uniref:Hydro-lyase n=1 Tax=Pseudocohnilembus persalinus TaxID=266149 RepID=A0A0V0QC14_PSEPJ|nr:hypothetical protein PPERSA_07842 [Pseudocohnilembus persalinus]|eukprot:KRW99765.1 hypothetical protein PPERSA_07842 [Pseudocohnilembus persalinus]
MSQQKNLQELTPLQIRLQCRKEQFCKPTAGLAKGFVQANLVVLPEEFALDFKNFCKLNPVPCPLIDDFEGFNESKVAKNLDIKTDLPLYRVFKYGKFVEQIKNINQIIEMYKGEYDRWHTFLIGCSFTFENALIQSGIDIRHITQQKNVSMYITNIEAQKSGMFQGKVVVSMRPIKKDQVDLVKKITEQFPTMHGGPIHIGEPEKIGIQNLKNPDFGDPVDIYEDEVPVFWGCGVTPQSALAQANLPVFITHSPGFMLICDAKEEMYRVQ